MEPILTTARLVLRRLVPADVDNLWTLYGDAGVMRHIALPTMPYAELASRELPALLAEYALDERFGYWAAETADGEFVGRFGLHPAVPSPDPLLLWERGGPSDTATMSLGYRVRRAMWGRGYATELARALVDRAFAELGADEVVATTMAVNAGSRRVMTKAGLTYVRTVHLDWPDPLPGSEHGDVVYRIARADWARRSWAAHHGSSAGSIA